MCAACRTRDAAVIEDPGERWARPLCFDCAEDVLDRLNAFGEHREAAEMIVGAKEEAVYRPLPAPRVDWETADRSKLERLRALWRAFEAERRMVERCWAILGDGSRCRREAADAGVCETHAVMGCRLPGLGWQGGEPQGRIVVRQRRMAA